MGATPRSHAPTRESPPPPLSAAASEASAIDAPHTGSGVWQESLPGCACPLEPAERNAHAQTTPINPKARVRTAVGGGRKARPHRNRKCSRVPAGFTSATRGSLLIRGSESVWGVGAAAHTDRLCFFPFTKVSILITAAQAVMCTPLIPALRRASQVNLLSSRPV